MADRKTEFYWASIAGANPEPVEVTEVDGRRAAYTCGCADPFFLDEDDTPIVLGREMVGSSVGLHDSTWVFTSVRPQPMERPALTDLKLADKLARRYDREVKEANRPRHGWRGPR